MIQEGVSILAHPLYFSSSNKCGFNLMVCAKIRAPSVPENHNESLPFELYNAVNAYRLTAAFLDKHIGGMHVVKM